MACPLYWYCPFGAARPLTGFSLSWPLFLWSESPRQPSLQMLFEKLLLFLIPQRKQLSSPIQSCAKPHPMTKLRPMFDQSYHQLLAHRYASHCDIHSGEVGCVSLPDGFLCVDDALAAPDSHSIVLSFLLTTDFPSFAGFAANRFTCITDTFAFIRLRFTQSADPCRNLTHLLFVDPADTQLGSLGSRINSIDTKSNSLGRLNFNRMGIPNLNHQIVTYFSGTVTHTMNF